MECLDKDTVILMNDGSTKKVQDIVPGDQLMSSSRDEACIVTATTGLLEDELFKISYKGGYFVCNSNHALFLKNNVKIDGYDGNFVVSFFCPATLQYKYQTCTTLRSAVLIKNFLIDNIDIIDITVGDYFTSDCKLPLYSKYYTLGHGAPSLSFKITYSHHGECYTFEVKNDTRRLWIKQ